MRATGNSRSPVSDTLSIRFSPDGLAFGSYRLARPGGAEGWGGDAVRHLAANLPQGYAGRIELFFETFRMTAFPPGAGFSPEAALAAVGFALREHETALLAQPSDEVSIAVVADREPVDYLADRFGRENVYALTPFDRVIPLLRDRSGPCVVVWLAERFIYASRSSVSGRPDAIEVYPYKSEADIVYVLSVLSAEVRKPDILLCGPQAPAYKASLGRVFRRLRCV